MIALIQGIKRFKDEGEMAAGFSATMTAKSQEFNDQLAVVDRRLQQVICPDFQQLSRATADRDGGAVRLVAHQGHLACHFASTNRCNQSRLSPGFRSLNAQFSGLHHQDTFSESALLHDDVANRWSKRPVIDGRQMGAHQHW